MDGLKRACKTCTKDYVPNTSKRDVSNIEKECTKCGRLLMSRCFAYRRRSEDHLSPFCRTCAARKHGFPTASEADAFEISMDQIVIEATKKLIAKYNQPYTIVIEQHRIEFEELVQKMMLRQGLLGDWKQPVWMSYEE